MSDKTLVQLNKKTVQKLKKLEEKYETKRVKFSYDDLINALIDFHDRMIMFEEERQKILRLMYASKIQKIINEFNSELSDDVKTRLYEVINFIKQEDEQSEYSRIFDEFLRRARRSRLASEKRSKKSK